MLDPVDPLLLAYLSFTIILVMTPGATTAVVVRHTLAGGRSSGLAAAAGAAVGNTSHATAAGLGLAVIFAERPLAFAVLQVAGAFYLAWLGAVSVARVIRHADGGLRLDSAEAPSSANEHRRGSFRQGLAVNLLNPAIATFYLIVVPSFLPSGASRSYFAVLAALHVVIAFTWHGVWAFGLGRLRRLFQAPRARRALEAATGVALIGLAVRVLMQQ